ncbi:MAG: hypothetical protein JKX76_01140 [Colwellia sp.]|nr:hypothetical protein [Colwellia sp.]
MLSITNKTGRALFRSRNMINILSKSYFEHNQDTMVTMKKSDEVNQMKRIDEHTILWGISSMVFGSGIGLICFYEIPTWDTLFHIPAVIGGAGILGLQFGFITGVTGLTIEKIVENKYRS